METRFLKISIADKVATVTIDRPEKRNALSPEVLAEIEGVFNRLGDDEEANVIVLTGGEKFFSAGFDLDYIRTIEKDANERFCELFHRADRAIMFCRLPVIAAVGGPAIAGGFDLTLMCDIRYASARAKFGQREVVLALTPLLDPLWRIVGLGNALEVALTGRIYDAEEALRLGYVSKVFAEGKLLESVLPIAKEMAGYDRKTLEATKALSRMTINSDLDRSMRTQEWLFRSFIGSEENHRRVDALRESLKKK